MQESLNIDKSDFKNKTDLYNHIADQIKAIVEDERMVIPNLCNTSSVLKMYLKDINWVGFYLIKGKELILGPFQGKPACIRIPIGKGVCGTAALKNEDQVVVDVDRFPGHIACDSDSRSEIVIPFRYKGKVIGVLDVDSPLTERFDDDDKNGLKLIISVLETACDWSSFVLY